MTVSRMITPIAIAARRVRTVWIERFCAYRLAHIDRRADRILHTLRKAWQSADPCGPFTVSSAYLKQLEDEVVLVLETHQDAQTLSAVLAFDRAFRRCLRYHRCVLNQLIYQGHRQR